MSCKDALDIKCFSKEVEFCGRCARWDEKKKKGLCQLTNEGTGFFYKCTDFTLKRLRCSIFDKECPYYLVTNYCGKTGIYLGLDIEHGLMVDPEAFKEVCSLPPT